LDDFTQLDRKLGAKNHETVLFSEQHATHLKNTIFLSDIKVIFLPANCTSQLQPQELEIIHVFKCHHRKHLIWKTVAIMDGSLLQDATQMKLDVLSAVHLIAEAWRLVTPPAIKNCFVKCAFSNDRVSGNDGSGGKLSEDEDENWHSLQPLGVQFEDYTTCDNAPEVCGVQSVEQVLDQHLTTPEEEGKLQNIK
jgi:hypothetical protein